MLLENVLIYGVDLLLQVKIKIVLTYRYTLIMAVIIKNGNWFEAGTEHIDL